MADYFGVPKSYLIRSAVLALESGRPGKSAEYLGLAGRLSRWMATGLTVEPVLLESLAGTVERAADTAAGEGWPELEALDAAADALYLLAGSVTEGALL